MLPGRPLRIGSFNAWGFFGDWKARLEVLHQHPLPKSLDVLLAQEVCTDEARDQVEDLSHAFELYEHVYHSSKEVNGVKEGVAIFSKLPLFTVGRTDLGNGHGLVQADLGNGLTLASAHLSFEGRDRVNEVRALLKRTTLSQVVLGADFHGDLPAFSSTLARDLSPTLDRTPTWPVCPQGVFTDAWEVSSRREVDFSLTPRKIDHILTRGVKVLDAHTVALEVEGIHASDHALLYCEVLVP